MFLKERATKKTRIASPDNFHLKTMRKALYQSILLLAVLVTSTQLFAAQVNEATARATAISFFKSGSSNSHGSVNVTLKYKETKTDGTVIFYVYDINPGKGFVMISADDRVKPIIAYSLETNFVTPRNGAAVQTWMQHASDHIYQAIQRHAPPSQLISSQWAAYAQGQKPASAKSNATVAPLLTTRWDQEPYYNQLCPFNAQDNMRTVTGCVATAMAQIMKFWNYPQQGTGYYGYLCAPPNCFYNYGSQSANFGATTYNWANIPDSLSSNNISVATLMYQCGVAVGMAYGDDNQGGSGSYVLRSDVSSVRHSAEMAFASYFNYNPNTLLGVHESNFSPSDWLNMIEAELNAGRPIEYAGTDPNEGSHTWVCDGYDENDLLHMNWGWGGFDNGYYSISSLTGDNYNFSTREEALLGIQPMSDLAVTASASRSTICSGGLVTLTATGPANVNYHWTPSAGLSCPTCATTTANPSSTTTYTVTIDSAGLSANTQVAITITAGNLSISTINITNVTQNGLNDGTASVMVSGGTPAYSYLWNNNATTDTILNLSPGSYQVTVSDAAGCKATATANVTQPDSTTTEQHNGHSEGTARESGGTFTGTFTNKGSVIYIQKSALVEVQGTLVNTLSDSTGIIKNDGIIELSGNFQNDSGALFQVGANSASTDRAVKFIGTGTQVITGNMSIPGKSSFYNLVIDQSASSDTVEMQTPLVVEGSLAFGTASVTTTYNPTSLYTNNNRKGLLKTFNNSLGEFLLNITNGNSDAISGYPVLEINGAPSTGFILTSGLRGTNNGGLQRAITSATSYLYPIGSYDKGFNAAKLNFTEIPGGGSVKAKFCTGSSDPSGFVGSISTWCSGCSGQNPAPADSGYNRYFPSNECNNGAPQWLILDHTTQNHGYWSFASTNTGYKYDMEVYPNGFPLVEQSAAWRLLKHEAAYGVDPSMHATDWREEIESTVSSVTDLLTYTKNIGCYHGAGVPGGSYTGFSHFTMGMGGIGQALPVQLLSLTATPTGKHHILVSWTTALEINNAGFYVMRSTDGVNFSDVGWVQGHDNSTITNNYTLDDRVPQNTLYYYKLRQVDNNGKFVYSYIVEAQLADQSSTDFALYPNPTSNEIFLDVKNAAEEVKVDMYDISGQLVYNNIFTITASGSNQTLTINASSMLPPGTYILNATMNEEKYSAKVILQ
jgi:Peptidase C10 family/Spi protease inhibitor/Secretion system C-terminal sorting domain/SprB repeat